MKKYTIDSTSDGITDELYGVPRDKFDKMVAKGFSPSALLDRIKKIHERLGYVTDSLLRIGNKKIDGILDEIVAQRDLFELQQAEAIQALESFGLHYSELPQDYQSHFRPTTILPRAKLLYERLGRVPHGLLRYSEIELGPLIDQILERESVQMQTRNSALRELEKFGIIFDQLPPSIQKGHSLEKLAERARTVVSLTGGMPSNKDLSKPLDQVVEKIRRRMNLEKEVDLASIYVPQVPESIENGSQLYVHCLPHQSAEFAPLHGTKVEVIFKGDTTRKNPRFDTSLVEDFERKNGKQFSPSDQLMVAIANRPAARPFIIPRNLLFKNKPNTKSEINAASVLLTERPNDSVKVVTGGARQMAHEPRETREIRKKIPRVILLTPQDDRYALAMHFVRYEFRSQAYGSNRRADLSKVVCWLPDFRQDGEPVVWIVDEKIFLSHSPNTVTTSTRESVDAVFNDAQHHVKPEEDSAVMKESPTIGIRRRLSFNPTLPKDIKSLFSEDDLWFDGNLINLSDVPTGVSFTQEEIQLLARGAAVASVFFVPKLNRYLCIERRSLSIIPR